MRKQVVFCVLGMAFNLLAGAQVLVPASHFSPLAASKDHYSPLALHAGAAALPEIQKWKASLYTEKRYLLPELQLMQLALCFPSGKSAFGFGLQYLGVPGYQNINARFAYGRPVSTEVDLGLQFNLGSTNTSGYGSEMDVQPALSLLVRLGGKIRTSMQFSLPGISTAKKQERKMPLRYQVVCGWDISSQCYGGLEIFKQEGQQVQIRTILHYALTPSLFTRAGIETGASVPWFSAGYRFGNFSLEVLTSLHASLGVSPALAIHLN